jgi:hypothetical protein
MGELLQLHYLDQLEHSFHVSVYERRRRKRKGNEKDEGGWKE